MTTDEKLKDLKAQIDGSKVKVKEMPLGKLGLENIQGVNYLTISNSDGQKKIFTASTNAIKSLAKMLNIEGLISNLETSIGKEAASRILNVIRAAISKNNKMVRIVLDFAANQIVDVIEKAPEFLGAEQFLKIVESKLDSKSEIINYSVNANGTQITFKSENWGFKIPGKKDEDYHLGMMFSNSPITGTEIMPYFYRLVCTNGMVAGRGIDTFSLKLNGKKENEILEFVTGINKLDENSFNVGAFADRIKFMENTRASLREVKRFKNLALELSNFQNKQEIEKATLNQQLDDFFPTNDIEILYFKKGMDLSNYTSKHLSNIKSEITTWDLLNAATDFSSHDYGFNIKQENVIKIQGQAGEYMAKKTFDTEFLMPQLIK